MFWKRWIWDLLLVGAVLILFMALSGCVTRKDIEASIWLTNGMDLEKCGTSKEDSAYPWLWDYGFYRKLDTGKLEFMPFCNPEARHYLAMHERDFQRLIDATLPKEEEE